MANRQADVYLLLAQVSAPVSTFALALFGFGFKTNITQSYLVLSFGP
jgi:hypothetical protein